MKKLFKKRAPRLNVFEYWNRYHGVEYYAMVDEIAKRTKLPKFICRAVYDAEFDVLKELGITD